ncbi:UNVERIFIED_CONTAM: putative cysteine protease RD19D [Sesamum latifolium]|uniref:Cysteine protease RD19D n=1 Tax=Sesamum latifolium TaxID=2727402 RepID=A0AAW2TDR7_9LAMI
MKGGGLAYAVGVASALALLTCALALHVNRQDDAKILQVTENYHANHHLLGTAAELRFKSFMQEYGKEYPTRAEYLHRLGIFAKNLIRAAEHQAMDPTAVHGVTQFSDLSEEEFEGMYMGIKGGGGGARRGRSEWLRRRRSWRWGICRRALIGGRRVLLLMSRCSTTGVIEGANFIATGKLLNLSEQQLVDCDHACDAKEKRACDDGCMGGLMTNAYKYLIEAGGIEEEESYPYTGKRGECKFRPEKVAVRIANFTTIPINENQIAAHLVRHGPLAVGLNAVFMQTYIGGVSCPLICGKRWINHGVLLVGYGSRGYSILRLGYKPYWIIKNSWGKRWGEHGYYRLCRGHGMCGMNTMVSAVMTQTS